jgi:hypothetical protein
VFWLPPESAEAVEDGFDRYAGVMEQVQAAG